MSKRSISVKPLVEDIRKGLSDAELMQRHELSHDQLRKVLAQLVKAGYVGQEVLDGRRQKESTTSSVEFEGTHEPDVATESRSSETPRPAPLQPHSSGLPAPESSDPGLAESSSASLPYSREQAARFRRNGLSLILASFGLISMMIILSKLREGVEGGVFPNDEIGLALSSFGALGWIVSAVWGCFWRLRGLGQSAAWTFIVIPVFAVNYIVLEALPNRYEPKYDVRLLRLAFAVVGIVAWGIALVMINRSL